MAAPNPDFLDERAAAADKLRQRRSAAQQVERIRCWLAAAPEWRATYEQTARRRCEGSGVWFLHDHRYQKWKTSRAYAQRGKESTSSLRGEQPRGILSVEAKPGFGKTYLSSIIVDDLKSSEGPLHHDPSNRPAVAFFHFNARKPETHRSAMQALRAVATQLLNTHQNHRDAIHQVAFWIEEESSGQHQPSFEDVFTVIQILLQHCPTFLVFDGVDECHDYDLFLAAVYELCESEGCRVLLLGRPINNYPEEFQNCGPKTNWLITLKDYENIQDIGRYLHPRLESIASRGLLGGQMIDRGVFDEIVRRADGNFLWATLFEQFLNSPALSPHERYDTLHRENHLRGLGALYNGILSTLTRRNEREKTITADIFRWLAHPIKPLSIEALHAALAVIPGQPTHESQYLPNFPECISEITCGLASLDASGTPVFKHRSVQDHLQSNQCVVFDFSLLDESAVHAHLGSRCISYLAHDIPKQPLEATHFQQLQAPPTASGTSVQTIHSESSGDSGFYSQPSSDDDIAMDTTADTPDIESAFPLLRYAVLCWPVHLSRSLSLCAALTAHGTSASPYPAASVQPPDHFPASAVSEAHLGWVSILSQFLLDRLAVTAWVESSWRYRLPPNLSRLVPMMERLHASIGARKHEARELKWVILGFKELRDALNELRLEHQVELCAKPSLIWHSSTHLKGSDGFWPLWDPQFQS